MAVVTLSSVIHLSAKLLMQTHQSFILLSQVRIAWCFSLSKMSIQLVTVSPFNATQQRTMQSQVAEFKGPSITTKTCNKLVQAFKK